MEVVVAALDVDGVEDKPEGADAPAGLSDLAHPEKAKTTSAVPTPIVTLREKPLLMTTPKEVRE